MRELNQIEILIPHGGLNGGVIAGTIIVGFVTGGPAGAGIAATGIAINHGVDKFKTLVKKGKINLKL